MLPALPVASIPAQDHREVHHRREEVRQDDPIRHQPRRPGNPAQVAGTLQRHLAIPPAAGRLHRGVLGQVQMPEVRRDERSVGGGEDSHVGLLVPGHRVLPLWGGADRASRALLAFHPERSVKPTVLHEAFTSCQRLSFE